MGDYGKLKNEQRFDSVSKRVSTNLHDKLRKCVDNLDICMTPVDGDIEFVKFVLSNACNISDKIRLSVNLNQNRQSY